jgi:hypothetical protein
MTVGIAKIPTFFKNGNTGNIENSNKITGKYRYLPDKIKQIKKADFSTNFNV